MEDSMTKKSITKIVFTSTYGPADVVEAIRSGSYSKEYIWDDGDADRIEYYTEGVGLVKVTYFFVPDGREAVVLKHYQSHPGVLCEFVVKLPSSDVEASAEAVDLYDEAGMHEKRTLILRNKDNRRVRRVVQNSKGETIKEQHEIYNAAGRLVGTKHFDANGKFIKEIPADDWE
jgi:hypothetical protein